MNVYLFKICFPTQLILTRFEGDFAFSGYIFALCF